MHKRPSKSLKFYLRLIRHHGTPESVGRGAAAGLFSAFITPIGQMPLALLLALPLRGAKITAMLTTWITNPLNMPVVYPAQCYLGSFLIGSPLSYTLIKQMVSDLIHNPSMKTVGALSGELIASFLAGGLLLGGIMAVSGYFLATELTRRYRARKIKRKEHKINRWKMEGR
jgi:uncharacterized protein